MSVASLTTLSAVRERRSPTKRDVGKATDEADEEKPSASDLLVTVIPTELVAPYTALTAAIVGAIDKPTAKAPDPDQFELWRWLAFVVLVLTTAVVVRGGAKKKGVTREPKLEVAVATIAAAGWASALPESPLIPYLDDKTEIFVPLFAALVAIALILGLGGRLTRKA